MAVTITAPTSQLVNRSGGVTVAWSSDYPQSAYEILYRRKGTEAWSTLGRVESGEQKAELDTTKFSDCVEYHYRVVCYAQKEAGDADTVYTGSDSSPAYSLILAPDSRAMMKLHGSSGLVEVPLYDELRGGGEKVSIQTDSGRGQALLVEPGSALASPLLVKSGQNAKPVAGGEPKCEDTGVDNETNLEVQKRYYSAYNYQSAYTYNYKYAQQYQYSAFMGYTVTGYLVGHYNAGYNGYAGYTVYAYDSAGKMYFYGVRHYYYVAYIGYTTVPYSYYGTYFFPGTAYQYQTGQNTGYKNQYGYTEQYYQYAIRE